MKAFSVFLILIGVLSFLSIFGMMNVTFGMIVGVFFAIIFGVEGVRELVKGNLIGVGGILFAIFLFVRVFVITMTNGQTFAAFIASYLIAIGLQMLFKRREKFDFWKD